MKLTMEMGSTQPLADLSNRYISLVLIGLARRADKFTAIICRLSSNLRGWNPHGFFGFVQGLLYLYLYLVQLILPQVGKRSMDSCNLLVQNVLEIL
jgi:hypothetical protein